MKKILLVNDCKFESLVMKDCLNDIGYSVQIANEYDVFIQVRKSQPDIVIANLIMKDTTGDKLIEYIKSTNPEIICLLSSCDLIKLEDFLKSKVDGVIHTPINEVKLSEVLAKVLSERENSSKKITIHRGYSSLRDEGTKRNNKELSNNASENQKKDRFYFCPYCGEKFGESDQNFLFCPHCGQRVKN